MRRILIYIIMPVILIGCGVKKVKYQVENQILDCFYYQHEKLKIDVRSKIDSVEMVLIKHHIITDNSGKSYISLLKKIRKYNSLPFELSDQLYYDLNAISYIPRGLRCKELNYIHELDSASLLNSKFNSVLSLYDLTIKEDSISPEKIAIKLLEVFNERDFDQLVYRTLGIISLANIIKYSEKDKGENIFIGR